MKSPSLPTLAEVPIEYRWKGPISVCADLVPTPGFLGDARILFSGGFVGHGISIAQLDGRTCRRSSVGPNERIDRVLGRQSSRVAVAGQPGRTLAQARHLDRDATLRRLGASAIAR